MRIQREVRRLMQRFGFDVVRYPLHDPLGRTVRLMKHHRVGTVIDVGANDGGFAQGIRSLGFDGRIISFEPLQEPYTELCRRARGDSKWDTVQMALGDIRREISINVSGNRGLSSSVLPMLETHASVAPESRYVATETVAQAPLDELLNDLGVIKGSRAFLKIDVQGYEDAVLEGASAAFAERLLVGLQLELSLIPLYDGGMSYREGLDRAEALGMALMGLDPVFADPNTGQLLQADAVFFSP